jgi:4-amino-4-deoxy-L-arabinose transferase-like glycosyltransferase
VFCHVALLVIILLGVSIRLYNIHHGTKTARIWGDEWQYDSIGRNLATGHGYSIGKVPKITAGRVPVTPLLVAAIYRIDGKSDLLFAQTVWAFLDMLNCLIVFALAIVICRSRFIGVLASAGYAFHPAFIRIGSHVMSEIPFTGLLLTSLILLILYWRSRSWRLLCLSAIAMGLSMLARPTSALFPAVIIVIMFLAGCRERQPWIARALVYCALIALTVAPWSIRCSMVSKQFVPLCTYGGWSIWAGAGPGPHGEILMGPWCDPKAQKVVDTMSETDSDRYLKKEAVRLIKAHPMHWIGLSFGKFFTLWFRMFKPESRTIYGILLALSNLMLMVFAWRGTKLTGSPMLKQLLIGLFVYFSITHMATYAELRYATPVYAYIFPFAAFGLVSWLARHSPRLQSLAGEIG